MNHRHATLAALALAGGCVEEVAPRETEAAADIGVCGANMDPLSGVECLYGASTPSGSASRRAVVETGPDGLDYLVCYFEIDCVAHGEAVNGGRTCQAVVGTGCGDRVVRGTQRDAFPLPPGSPPPSAEELARACNYDLIPHFMCEAVPPATVEQGEDLCCVLREPVGPPVARRVFGE